MNELINDIPQDTINAALRRATETVPEKTYLDFSGETYSFSEVDRLSTELAHGLRDAGVEPGDRVATMLLNNVDAVISWFAVNKIGAVFAPVNTAFKADYLHSQVEDCSAAIALVENEFADRIAEIIPRLPALKMVYVRGATSTSEVGNVPFLPLNSLRTRNYEAIPDEVEPDTLSMLVYTSGTTGKSKGCMIPHNMVCNMGWNSMHSQQIQSDDVLWTALPLFHLNAIGVTVGTALIAQCGAAVFPRFSLSGFWPDIERSGATRVALLGSMASLIADAPDNEASKNCFGQLRSVSAAPFATQTSDTWIKRFGIQSGGSRGYGMTEVATVSGLRQDEPPGPDGSSGMTGRDFEVIIADDKGLPVPIGAPGEILVRPRKQNIMFQGYWDRHEATIAAFRNLWFHTGDIGKLDEQGFLYFLDRKKDYIRRRGENISTMEVESVFRQHPAVRDIAVHAVKSPLGEDDVKATIELADDASIGEEELCRWSIEKLPYFAVPLYIEFRDELPRGGTGKVLKEGLKSDGVTPRTWDREAAGVTFERK